MPVSLASVACEVVNHNRLYIATSYTWAMTESQRRPADELQQNRSCETQLVNNTLQQLEKNVNNIDQIDVILTTS